MELSGGSTEPQPIVAKLQISDYESLVGAVRNPTTGFVVKDRSWRLKSYPKCFIGEEAVKWIQDNVEGALSIGDALFVGQMLMDKNVIRHVVDKKKPFLNEYLFYRFVEEDEPPRSNRKSVPIDDAARSFAEDPQKWDKLVTLFRKRVDIADRKWGLKTYPSCFLGSTAATTIIQLAAEIAGVPMTRASACHLLQLMADSYLFVHVTSDLLHVYRDDPKVYFKFVDPIVYSTKYLKDRLHAKRIGEAKARGEGCRAKRPIVLIPGIFSSVLEVWQSLEKPKWLREKLWIDLSKVGFFSGKDTRSNVELTDEERRAMAKEFVRHMMPGPDGCSDPPGIKVRPREGVSGIDFLTDGFFKDSSIIFETMIRNLLDVGYDINQIIPAPYDWRIPPTALEQRDAYFSRLKASIEFAVHATNQRAVLVGHSMGCKVISYFLNWVQDQNWIDQHVESAAFLAPPFLGAPFALRAMITGDTLNLSPLLSAHEGAQICRAMGSWPWLMPLATSDSFQLPEPAARVKLSSEKKKKDKEAYTHVGPVDALKLSGAPGLKYWEDYFASNPHYVTKTPSAAELHPCLEVPPIRRLVCIYGVNLPTEVSYFFKVNDDNPQFLQPELDVSQDSISKKETKVLNPMGLDIRGGIMFESKSTPQPAFDKKKISGDGSIPYASMAYAHKLKERTSMRRAIGCAAADVEIIELESVGHRALLSTDATIGLIIDLGCK